VRRKGVNVLKLIHGYGSSGRGGKLRTALRSVLRQRAKQGTPGRIVEGEVCSIFDEASRGRLAGSLRARYGAWEPSRSAAGTLRASARAARASSVRLENCYENTADAILKQWYSTARRYPDFYPRSYQTAQARAVGNGVCRVVADPNAVMTTQFFLESPSESKCSCELTRSREGRC
jgi:hypothetical protein